MARNYAQSGGSSTFRFPASAIVNVAAPYGGGSVPAVSGQPCFIEPGSGPIYVPGIILTDADGDGFVTLSTRGILTVEVSLFGSTPVLGEPAYLAQAGDEFESGSGWGLYGTIIDVTSGWVQISLGQFGWT